MNASLITFCRRVSPGRLLPVAVLCAVSVGSVGCYERVIDARGIGTDTVNVQKPYRSETALDKAFFPDNSNKDSKGFDSSGKSSGF